jgi:hypothetical protein
MLSLLIFVLLLFNDIRHTSLKNSDSDLHRNQIH